MARAARTRYVEIEIKPEELCIINGDDEIVIYFTADHTFSMPNEAGLALYNALKGIYG